MGWGNTCWRCILCVLLSSVTFTNSQLQPSWGRFPGALTTLYQPSDLLNFIPAGPIFNPDTAPSLSLPGGSSLPSKAPGLPVSKQSAQIFPAASAQLESRQLKSHLHPNRHLDLFLLNLCHVPGSRARRQTEALVGGSLLVPHLPLTLPAATTPHPPPADFRTISPCSPGPSCFSPALEGKAGALCSRNGPFPVWAAAAPQVRACLLEAATRSWDQIKSPEAAAATPSRPILTLQSRKRRLLTGLCK